MLGSNHIVNMVSCWTIQLAFSFHDTKLTTFTAFIVYVIWSGWSTTHLTVCYIWLIEDVAVETRSAMLPQAWRGAPTLRPVVHMWHVRSLGGLAPSSVDH